ncbi:hypothetical protein SAMN05421505_13644 [Sinosporangium album]|uniref:Uncharacterized protein n=1 Tax=Sinosporangium album TaxID=504805 RepID=A0A1G8IC39_9ACTN|nr:hypothetical protein SAMN05421505_13644 [Sinosporangium album]
MKTATWDSPHRVSPIHIEPHQARNPANPNQPLTSPLKPTHTHTTPPTTCPGPTVGAHSLHRAPSWRHPVNCLAERHVGRAPPRSPRYDRRRLPWAGSVRGQMSTQARPPADGCARSGHLPGGGRPFPRPGTSRGPPTPRSRRETRTTRSRRPGRPFGRDGRVDSSPSLLRPAPCLREATAAGDDYWGLIEIGGPPWPPTIPRRPASRPATGSGLAWAMAAGAVRQPREAASTRTAATRRAERMGAAFHRDLGLVQGNRLLAFDHQVPQQH